MSKPKNTQGSIIKTVVLPSTELFRRFIEMQPNFSKAIRTPILESIVEHHGVVDADKKFDEKLLSFLEADAAPAPEPMVQEEEKPSEPSALAQPSPSAPVPARHAKPEPAEEDIPACYR